MLEDMHILAKEIYSDGRIKGKCSPVDGRECDDPDELAFDYVAMLNAVIAVLDGAKYLWENTDEKQPHA